MSVHASADRADFAALEITRRLIRMISGHQMPDAEAANFARIGLAGLLGAGAAAGQTAIAVLQASDPHTAVLWGIAWAWRSTPWEALRTAPLEAALVGGALLASFAALAKIPRSGPSVVAAVILALAAWLTALPLLLSLASTYATGISAAVVLGTARTVVMEMRAQPARGDS